MMKFPGILLVIIGFIFISGLQGHSQDESVLHQRLQKAIWTASWITHPTALPYNYGVYHFRKEFDLESKEDQFIVHVSGDNRYQLFVNGKKVSMGPSRGDVDHWRFETIDIASYLVEGNNVLAAVVWNFGQYRPVAQFSFQTGFMLQSDQSKHDYINTNRSWKVVRNESYLPETESIAALHSYYVVGPGEIIDGNKYPWGWEKSGFDDSEWISAGVVGRAKMRGFGTDGQWLLVPRMIPVMEESLLRLHAVRSWDGVELTNAVLEGTSEITVPANSSATWVLDQGFETTAYPVLLISGGSGSEISISYAEAMFDKTSGQKGNRNEVGEKELIGNRDLIYPDGGNNRKYQPLWFRTYRYIGIKITTKEKPVTIHDFYGMFTAYPFEKKAVFESSDPSLVPIWDVGWRTARLCAGETYYDCPYYEQLQYAGDTRIQALISMYVAGDDRLMRKMLVDFNDSRIPDGLTQSRYPAYKKQIIPPYSLFWIAMVYDYWMHRQDTVFVQQFLPGIDDVLSWFEQHINDDNLLGPLEWWNFVDWTEEWQWDPEIGFGGSPESARNGNSALLSLQYVYTLDYASALFRGFGDDTMAGKYSVQSEKIKKAVFDLCWDAERQLLADTPNKDTFSQHTNIMGILTNSVPEIEQMSVMKRTISDPDLIQATFYFQFYLFEAIKKVGMGDEYLSLLQPWHQMIENGLTTFAEKPDPVRSDCHAWSASPNYHLLSLVAGIRPAAPGFNKIVIEPNLGNLMEINVSIPHPQGAISVNLAKTNHSGIRGKITLPAGISGTFIWKKETIELREGLQEIVIE